MTNREITFRALHLVKQSALRPDGSSDDPAEAEQLKALSDAHGSVAAQMALRTREAHPEENAQCTPEEMAEIIARTMHEKSINPAKFL